MTKYHDDMINKVLQDKDEYGFHMKIHSTNEATNWFLISEKQLKQIQKILR